MYLKQLATVFASANGLKVTVEDAKCVQANAFIQAGVFQEFTMGDGEDSATFKINLSIWLVRLPCYYILINYKSVTPKNSSDYVA